MKMHVSTEHSKKGEEDDRMCARVKLLSRWKTKGTGRFCDATNGLAKAANGQREATDRMGGLQKNWAKARTDQAKLWLD